MELNTCPFCGGEVLVEGASANYSKKTISGTFECCGCGAKIKLKTNFTESPINDLYNAWNKRVGGV